MFWAYFCSALAERMLEAMVRFLFGIDEKLAWLIFRATLLLTLIMVCVQIGIWKGRRLAREDAAISAQSIIYDAPCGEGVRIREGQNG